MTNNKQQTPHGFCETPEQKCTMNYCDENGCQNRKRTSAEPIEMPNNKQQTEMNKEFVPYELALELRQLEFDETCLFYYYGSNNLQSLIQIDMPRLVNHNESILGTCYSAPSYSQAFRFFREKYKLKYCIIPLVCEQGFSDLYESRIHQEKHSISIIGNYKIYEEAELDCLKEMIKIVKSNYGKQ